MDFDEFGGVVIEVCKCFWYVFQQKGHILIDMFISIWNGKKHLIIL